MWLILLCGSPVAQNFEENVFLRETEMLDSFGNGVLLSSANLCHQSQLHLNCKMFSQYRNNQKQNKTIYRYFLIYFDLIDVTQILMAPPIFGFSFPDLF